MHYLLHAARVAGHSALALVLLASIAAAAISISSLDKAIAETPVSRDRPAAQRLANEEQKSTSEEERAAAARRRAFRDADEAARREAEKETQRRLDQIILEQLLRDAGRP